MSDIRRLDPENDVALYRQVWNWQSEYPRSLRDATGVHAVESFEEFLEQAKADRVHVGIFDPNLCAVVGLQWVAGGVYEIHLSAKRGTTLEQILEPCLNIQKTVFEDAGARYWFLFTPEWNRGAIRLATAAGLIVDGVSKIHGTSRGRVLKWLRMSQTREDYERDIAANTETDGQFAVQPDEHVYPSGEYARHRAA